MKKIKLLLFPIILCLAMTQSCSKTKNKNTKTAYMNNQNNDTQENIETLIKIDTVTLDNYTTSKLFFSIKNQGSTPIKLIKRLSIGYQQTDNREVYLLITKNDSKDNIAKNAVFYSRKKAAKNDFEWLQPGESFKTDFIIEEWYEFPNGSFEIQAVYDPSESLPLDDSLTKGKYYSNKIHITNN